MLLHEKMRLQRKQNKLTLKQLRNGNQLSRMESKIKRREKYYSKLEKQLDTQANAMKNSMKMAISNQFGLASNSPYGSAGTYQIIQQMLGANGYTGPSKEIVEAIYNGGYLKDGKVNGVACTDEQYNQARTLINQAGSQMSMLQGQCQSAQAYYENQVSIWLDYQKEQLEAQQEWEMDLLAEEQADYEAEKESIAAELELVKQRKESIEQELGSSIKDAAPKFGLA